MKLRALAEIGFCGMAGGLVFLLAASLMRVEEITIVKDAGRKVIRKVGGKLGVGRGK